jgi:DNA-binding transcriptional ArsR family regulator
MSMAAATSTPAKTAPAKTTAKPKKSNPPAAATPEPTPEPVPAVRSAPAKRSAAHAKAVSRVAILLKQASDGTRLQILLSLLDGERHVSALCANLSHSQPAVSHHLSLLRHGCLIEPRRSGKNNFYMLTDKGRFLADAIAKMIADAT